MAQTAPVPARSCWERPPDLLLAVSQPPAIVRQIAITTVATSGIRPGNTALNGSDISGLRRSCDTGRPAGLRSLSRQIHKLRSQSSRPDIIKSRNIMQALTGMYDVPVLASAEKDLKASKVGRLRDGAATSAAKLGKGWGSSISRGTCLP